MLRITGGKFKGRRIETPGGLEVRPLPDIVRVALGNTLSAWFPGARVIEIFAGSGSFAFESLSRGAESGRMVELDRKVASLIKDAIEKLGVGEKAELRVADAFSPARYIADGEKFDIIFLGPPFPMYAVPATFDKIQNLVKMLIEKHLAPEGVLAIQVPARTDFGVNWDFTVREKIYGENKIMLFQNESA
jgi:16S rRNA (guanine966-N2)-methyltransferase